MKQTLESLFKKTPIHYPIRKWLRRQQWLQQRQVRDWVRRGKPGPAPHLVKQAVLRDYATVTACGFSSRPAPTTAI